MRSNLNKQSNALSDALLSQNLNFEYQHKIIGKKIFQCSEYLRHFSFKVSCQFQKGIALIVLSHAFTRSHLGEVQLLKGVTGPNKI